MAQDTHQNTQGGAQGRGLKLHHLRPAPGAHTAKTRVGRGEGSKGKTAGRGTKGTGARKNVPANFEGGQMPLHMRLPKLKGFKNPFRVEYQVVNVGRRLTAYLTGTAQRNGNSSEDQPEVGQSEVQHGARRLADVLAQLWLDEYNDRSRRGHSSLSA